MFGFKHGRLGSAGTRTLIQRAIASLRARGTDAHLWLPGGDVKTYGPELFADTLSGYTPYLGTAPTVLVSELSLVSTTSTTAVFWPITTVAGKQYTVSGTLRSPNTQTVYLAAHHSNANPSGDIINRAPSWLAAATFVEFKFVATGAVSYISVNVSQNYTAVVSSISVREITSITPTITSGLTTGNYLESTGNSVATVNNPVGLVLDALGTRTALTVLQDLTAWTSGGGYGNFNGATATSTTITASGEQGSRYIRFAVSPGDMVFFDATVVAGTSTGIVSVAFGTEASVYIDALYPAYVSSGAVHAAMQAPANAAFVELLVRAQTSGSTCGFTGLSASTISGIHLTQSTTANKGLLKQDAGSRYYWLFDATDLLTGTFPAGYESVTVIDAKSTGQVTTSAANVVGSYSIGPSYSSYGRIIIKGSITASELALYQGFANRLAGL